MKNDLVATILLCASFLVCGPAQAQRSQGENNTSGDDSRMSDSTFMGIQFRNIGPAFMSGRIADIAIHPVDNNVWYVAVGSGGVWKTTNAGTTWTPIFDNQSSYSIGCVTIDPSNPHTIWIGTGENVGGRHVGFGDGVYRSDDGGATWKNMGLKSSEHIAKVIVHPKNSDVIWVAAEGPLWTEGGERGLYKSTDGGNTWAKTLGDEAWVGVTDIALDPTNPDQMYAATWQRHRTVAAYMGGGPGSGIYRSTDGGVTWKKCTDGLPASNMGKIGLAVSPRQPDIVYAVIELDRRTGGLFRSVDRGVSWSKMSDTVSGATGPHYYQELFASPHQEDRLYLMDATMQISDDGGRTFFRMNETDKHGDNHAIAFHNDDPDYLLVGTDGGLYESFDLTKTWRYIENLPVTQYYKVALDDAEPFYNIYGGTQDNGSQGGPSRTDNVHGIQNSDWRLVLDWDGHQPATEPGNPDIVYAERQQGALSRIDNVTGEVVDIQPQPAAGEDYERFNWDAPILVSPHSPSRLYFASQRVWRSDDRGDAWIPISGDLTKNQERLALPIMGRTQSWDNPWDVSAMSNYNTITSLAESPLQEGLIYAGTDDGVVQVTENGGANWHAVEVGTMPGVPATAFVNDVKADLHDVNTVYIALDNHKYGDFRPFLLKSADRGRTWQSITGNIPGRTLIWRVVQDHVKPGLLFAATEFGIYFTIDGGGRWVKLQGDVPTISFRDLAIQRRENDLVGASFGRGFFILDDYSVLRDVSETQLEEATLFSPRKAWWYVPRSHLSFDDQKGSQGTSHYVAPNPPFGAVFTYYLPEDLKTRTATRKEQEKQFEIRQDNVTFPGWEALEQEIRQEDPVIRLTVQDDQGHVVRRLEGPAEKGFHRVAWDLRYPAPDAIDRDMPASAGGNSQGMMAAPGRYTVTLSQQVDGVVTLLSEPRSFEVVPMRRGALSGSPPREVAAFWRAFEETIRQSSAVQTVLSNAQRTATAMQFALARATAEPGDLDARLFLIKQDLQELDVALNGMSSKQQVGEKTRPTVGTRLSAVDRGVYHSTYGPTTTHREQLEIVRNELAGYQERLVRIQARLAELGQALINAGAPWVEGQPMPDRWDY